MRRLAICLGALWLGGRLSAAADGGQAVAFLKLPLDARLAALGSAGAALSGEAASVWSNPGLLAVLPAPSIEASGGLLESGRYLHAIHMGRPGQIFERRFGYGLSLAYLGLADSIELRASDTPEPDRLAQDLEYAAQASMGAVFGDGFSWGLNARYLGQNVAEAQATGFTLDLGFTWAPAAGWLLGLSGKDLLSRHQWSTGSADPLSSSGRFGLSRSWQNGRYLALAELAFSGSQDVFARWGFEAKPWGEAWALRLGLERLDWTAGFGAQIPLRGVQSRLDYAIGADRAQNGGLFHRVSLSLQFAQPEAKP